MTTPQAIAMDFGNAGEMLLVDKPIDWTSFDVVKKIKVLFKTRRVGHAGTLDPKASGLLIICTGRQTKTIQAYFDKDKEYTGTLELGVRTPSFDSETAVIERKDFSLVTRQMLDDSARAFTGKQMQIPPMYSAAKIEGQPLYRYARKGQTVERTPREVQISEFNITGYSAPAVDFQIVCSKGTYIRSLIEDFGKTLGCGAMLRSLRRTRIGSYRVEDAMTIEDLIHLRDTLQVPLSPQYEVSEPA